MLVWIFLLFLYNVHILTVIRKNPYNVPDGKKTMIKHEKTFEFKSGRKNLPAWKEVLNQSLDEKIILIGRKNPLIRAKKRGSSGWLRWTCILKSCCLIIIDSKLRDKSRLHKSNFCFSWNASSLQSCEFPKILQGVKLHYNFHVWRQLTCIDVCVTFFLLAC